MRAQCARFQIQLRNFGSATCDDRSRGGKAAVAGDTIIYYCSHKRCCSYWYTVIMREMAPGANVFFFQAEDGIRDRSPSRGLGDVYKRQHPVPSHA